MKMRKSTWLLLVLALVAIFLVAGCTATTGNGDEEPGNGEPTPPPTDKECPKPVKTVVSKIYDTTGDGQNFQIKITFDEDFNSSCIQNLNLWTIAVANPGRVGTLVVTKLDINVEGRVVTIQARVVETGTAPDPTYEELVELEDWEEFDDLEEAIVAAQAVVDVVNGYSTTELLLFLDAHGTEYGVLLNALEAAEAALATADAADDAGALAGLNAAYGLQGLGLQAVVTQGEAPVFYGLICNKDDVAAYEKEFGLAAGTVKYADKVTWKLSNCAVYDELGNVCCEYEGEACCVEPYCEGCPEPEEEWCDPTEPGACL